MGIFIEVHRHIGPGMPESCYEEALTREFDTNGIRYERQKKIILNYKGEPLKKHFRLDLLVEGKVVIEVKSVADILPVHHAQVIAYLRASEMSFGYLVNFNSHLLTKGVHRKTNNYNGEYDI
jgi:GxxExxY protein